MVENFISLLLGIDIDIDTDIDSITAALSDNSTTANTTAGHGEAVVKTTMPLPRAIQLAMTISSHLEPSTTASMKTIGEHGVDRFFAWMNLVFLPSMFIANAALLTYGLLRDDDDERPVSLGRFAL